MTNKTEIRVRPVQRHLVTVWQEGLGSRMIGEFESPSLADEVAWALRAKTPGATVVTSEGSVVEGQPLRLVIVPEAHYEPESIIYYASNVAAAKRVAEDAQEAHGMAFRIFACTSVEKPEINHLD